MIEFIFILVIVAVFFLMLRIIVEISHEKNLVQNENAKLEVINKFYESELAKYREGERDYK